jgi:radical SAM protein with 4Fe4S-binding SPASM domain
VRDSGGAERVLRLLFWESTIRCNLACAHCRRLESDEAADKDLSTGEARELIKQLAELGENQPYMPVLVFSGGEPLCRDDLFELVGQAVSLGITPALATNGTLIDGAVAQRIAESGIVRAAASLDGATAEIHDELRQVKGSFERAIEGIGQLREKGVPFQINVTLTKQNAEQLDKIYALAESLVAAALHIFMLVPVGCGRAMAEAEMLTAEEYERKLKEIWRLEGRGRLEMKVTCGPHYARVARQQGPVRERGGDGVRGGEGHKCSGRGCLAGLGVLFVGHQGDVFPCGYLPVRCGNVLESSLAEIWRGSKELAQLGDSSALEGKCGVCGYREICGGCRARAYAATGNYMAEEPFCAYIPPEAAR